jgi:Ca2+-binding RTX toxin-like protein
MMQNKYSLTVNDVYDLITHSGGEPLSASTGQKALEAAQTLVGDFNSPVSVSDGSKIGTAGSDSIIATPMDGFVPVGGAGNDLVIAALDMSCTSLYGSKVHGEFTVRDGSGSDVIVGQSDDNVFWFDAVAHKPNADFGSVSSDHDFVFGGAGFDTIRIEPVDTAVFQEAHGPFSSFYKTTWNLHPHSTTIDAAAGIATGEDFGTITFDSVERFLLGTGNLNFKGSNASETVEKINDLTSDDVISTYGGNDAIRSFAGSDKVYAGDGDDSVFAYSADDGILQSSELDGGAGYDTLSLGLAVQYSRSETYLLKNGYEVDLTKSSATSGSGDVFSIHGFEKIVTGGGHDRITGDAGQNWLDGGKGNDIIRGGDGRDTLKGGKGSDTFVWKIADVYDSHGKVTADRVTDFGKTSAGEALSIDRLDLTDFLKGQNHKNITDIVHLKDSAAGTMVSVKVGSHFVDVALLKGWHSDDVTSHMHDGFLLSG